MKLFTDSTTRFLRDSETAHRRRSVLYIDDDRGDFLLMENIAAQIEGLFESAGVYELEWAKNSKQGLDAIGEGRHDLYMVDYQLGSANGLKLIRKARFQGLRAPMILVTGMPDNTIDIEASAAGADDYLSKNDLTAELLERTFRYALQRYEDTCRMVEAQQRLEVLNKLASLVNAKLDLNSR